MIHQPLGGAQGQASDIKIQAEHILKIREKMNRILAENTARAWRRSRATQTATTISRRKRRSATASSTKFFIRDNRH